MLKRRLTAPLYFILIMFYLCALIPLISAVAALARSSPQHIFSNPPATSSDFDIPTVHESAIQARRVLHLESIGTLSTVFPSADGVDPQENRPSGLGGAPIGTIETLLYLKFGLTYFN